MDCPSALFSASSSARLPGLHTLRLEQGIHAVAVAKAALAMLNVAHTGQDVALLMQVQAGRTWPFVSPWIASHLPDPMNIAGCTLSVSPHIVRVKHDWSAKDLLASVQAELEEWSKHSHTPESLVASRLAEDDRLFLEMIKPWQRFNWLGIQSHDAAASLSDLDSRLKMILLERRLPVKILWDCGLDENDTTVLRVQANYDGACLDQEMVRQCVEQMLKYAGWLSDIANLDSKVVDGLDIGRR